jgi:hypothetical protein
MKIEITIDRLKLDPSAIAEAIKAALIESGALLEKEIRQRTPQGVGGAQSGLRGSIFSELRGSEGLLESITSSSLPYAAPVEFGTVPHFPPVRALIPWVEKFLTLEQGQTAEGVAFAVARAIARRGTPARKMFELGATDALPRITGFFKERLGSATARLVRKE